MTDIINPLLQWLNANPDWAAFVIFIISALESVAIIGTIVPGTIMMTAIGALAGAGVIPLWLTLLCATLGAIVGDGISYLVGHYFKDKIPQMWPFRNHPQWLEKGEIFFHKHGGKSVFIGRFVGPVRAIIPLIAGMLSMKPIRFYVANILSAIGWAPIYMLPGILLGAASLELPPDIAAHAILMLLLVTLFIIFCIWLIVKIFLSIGYKIDQLLSQFWFKLQSISYTKVIAVALKHHDKSKPHGQIVLAFYFMLTVAGFLLLASAVIQHGSSAMFINDVMFHLFRSFRSPVSDNVMIAITLLGEKRVLVPTIVALFAWLVFTKRKYLAFHVAVLCVFTVGSIEFFKHYVHSPRPWGILLSPENFSFPSGHTTLATTFFIGFAILLSNSYPSKRRLLCYSAIIIAFLVSISRVYLGVHWFTDVCAGWLLSAALLLFITICYNRKKNPQTHFPKLIPVTLTVFAVMYSLIFLLYFNQYRQNLKPIDYPTYSISMNTWWAQADEHTPVYRIGRFGIAEQIFNLQWVGNVDNIKQSLLDNNWETPPDRNWISALERITDVESTEHLPLVPALYLDKKPVLVLIKHTENKKRVLVLRLWDTNIVVQPGQERLLAGTVSMIPRTYNWLFRKKSNEIEINPSVLFEKSQKDFEIKTIQLSLTQTHQKLSTQPIILLIKPKAKHNHQR
jgi:membrane protein DedA with SNARE-associated domain/membrane-associated phospholipid phosphatase